MSRRSLALPASVAVAAALALGACGGSSGDAQDRSASAGSSNGQQQRGRGGFLSALQDPKVKSCVEKQGVTVPTVPSGAPGDGNGYGPPQDGQGPLQNGQAPPTNGQGPPKDGQRGGGFGGMNDALREALEKCGVTLPERPQGQGQAPPSTTATTNS